MNRVLIVIGTRPEAIKMAPLIRLLKQDETIDTHLCVSAQHRSMIDSMLEMFGLEPDFNLGVMQPGQGLAALSAVLLQELDPLLSSLQPNIVLVQGDTTTALMAGLAAYYQKIHVGHVEAGLRTHDRYSPWPEELNRTLLADLARLHFAPTESAKAHLQHEGVEQNSIHVTGNTVIDALVTVRDQIDQDPAKKHSLDRQFSFLTGNKPAVLITGHRRESFGDGLYNICQAVRRLALEYGVEFVYPVHLNPNVEGPVKRNLGDVDHVHLIQPLEYEAFVYLMNRVDLIITDSGGVQEEAPSLGKPVLVTREITERPEAVDAGTVELVGRETQHIVKTVHELLNNSSSYQTMSHRHNPYGDGQAAKRIYNHLIEYFSKLDIEQYDKVSTNE